MIKLDVGSIPEGVSDIDLAVDAAEIGEPPEGLDLRGPVEVRLKATRNGNDIFLKGKAAVKSVLQCGRCLDEYSLVLRCLIEVWCIVGTAGDQEDLGERDSIIEVPPGGKFADLADHVRSELLVLVPLKPLCDDTCKGLCPVCGTNLNTGSCSCDRDVHDSRWDALKKIK